MRRLVSLAAILAALVCVGAAHPGASQPAARSGHILGIVPPRNQARPAAGAGNLAYHGGPVMHTNTVYAIYWIPPGYSTGSGYTTTIDRYFADVAAASGDASNVYWSDTQYSDGSGSVQDSSSFAGSVTVADPLPTSGCSDADTSVCVSDSQIQSEIQSVIAREGWSAGPDTLFFLFTADGIGSCAGSDCAYTEYCAYHSWIGSGSSVVLYANMPYADTVPSSCDASSHPNGNDADATLNVTSHEHNEAITDEQGNAWYDSAGYENGDKCAWDFGSSLGATPNGAYNQLINGDPYELQQEWSNSSSGCVLTGT